MSMPEDVPGVVADLVGVVGELDAAGLAATTCRRTCALTTTG
jgi:hypothetical protein